MARYKLIDRPTATRRRALLHHQRAAAQRAAGRPYEALYLARKAHKLQPDFAPIAVQASALAEQSNQPRVARKMLESAWKAKPHPALAKAYLGLSGNSSASERLKLVERLHQLQPKHLESELALAEQAIAARAWPAAREALERARKLSPTASVYRLLAEVAQAEGDGEQARAFLAQAVDAAPDHAWSAFGPDGRFDSLRWGAPPKIVPLVGDERAELIPPSPERAPQVPVPMAPETTPVREAKVDAA
jgi:HemY protein